MRYLKVMGLALLAVFSTGALMASAAGAFPTPTHLTATESQTSVILTAEAETTQEFVVETGAINCTGTRIPEATVTVPATTIEVHPEFGTDGGCKQFGVKATIDTNGCNFVYHITETKEAGEKITASLTIVCEAGKLIKVTSIINCEITVGSQTVPGDLTIKNTGTSPTEDLTFEANYPNVTGQGLTYTESGTGCSHPGTHTDGGYKGKTTMLGFKDVAGKEGTRVGILID